MSQHYYVTTHKSRPVKITLGWDRPLQGYFMVIANLDAGPEEDDFLYSNLDDLELPKAQPDSIDPFIDRLEQFGIELPYSMISIAHLDGTFNTGNRSIDHTTAVDLASGFKAVVRTNGSLMPDAGDSASLEVRDGEGNTIMKEAAPAEGWTFDSLRTALCAVCIKEKVCGETAAHAYLGEHWVASTSFG